MESAFFFKIILLILKRNVDFLILKNQEWKTYVGTTVRWSREMPGFQKWSSPWETF